MFHKISRFEYRVEVATDSVNAGTFGIQDSAPTGSKINVHDCVATAS